MEASGEGDGLLEATEACGDSDPRAFSPRSRAGERRRVFCLGTVHLAYVVEPPRMTALHERRFVKKGAVNASAAVKPGFEG